MDFVIENTGEGTQTLSLSDLYNISKDPYIGSATISGIGEKSSLLIKLNNLYYIESISCFIEDVDSVQIKYSEINGNYTYITSYDTVVSGVTANISDYCKYLKVDLEPENDVLLYGFKVTTDNEFIGYGTDGDVEKFSVGLGKIEPQQIKLKNNTGKEQVEYCTYIDPTKKDIVKLSYEENGTYYSCYQNSVNFPDTFSWENGKFIGTSVSGSFLVSSGIGSFVYVSPVVALDNSSHLLRVFSEGNFSDTKYIDNYYEIDGYKNIGVKLYNIPPSGTWSNGNLPDDSDSLWGLIDGSLNFISYPNNSILESRYSGDDYIYTQLCVQLLGEDVEFLEVSKLGVEYPVTVSGVGFNGFCDLWVQTTEASQKSSEGFLDIFCLV